MTKNAQFYKRSLNEMFAWISLTNFFFEKVISNTKQIADDGNAFFKELLKVHWVILGAEGGVDRVCQK